MARFGTFQFNFKDSSPGKNFQLLQF